MIKEKNVATGISQGQQYLSLSKTLAVISLFLPLLDVIGRTLDIPILILPCQPCRKTPLVVWY